MEGHRVDKGAKVCDLREQTERAAFVKSWKGITKRGSYCCHLPSLLEYGGSLFSEVYSESIRSNGQKLQQGKCWMDSKEKFPQWEQSNFGKGCPEGFCNLWKCLKLNWVWSWVACPNVEVCFLFLFLHLVHWNIFCFSFLLNRLQWKSSKISVNSFKNSWYYTDNIVNVWEQSGSFSTFIFSEDLKFQVKYIRRNIKW